MKLKRCMMIKDLSVVKEDDERNGLTELPYDSFLQPRSAADKGNDNHMLSITPGEGKRPQPFETDENGEELSFPHLFPTGKFGFSMKRDS